MNPLLDDLTAQQLLDRVRGRRSRASGITLQPLDFAARSGDELRPMTFDDMIGQERLKSLLGQIVGTAKAQARPLDHLLLVGSAGTGKTTLAQVIAHELDRPVYMLKAPVDFGTFEELTRVANPGDIVIIDEIHMQVSGDRRGITQAADPETFYHVLEDKRLMTATGVLPFPDVTFIGCTTDAGLLPEPFLARFPLQPQLDPYTLEEMVTLATRNARRLRMVLTGDSGEVFARACRNVPRVVNRYLKNARALGAWDVTHEVAVEVVTELNSTTLDGLNHDMQNMLTFLLRSRRETKAGDVSYQAGIGSIATALGKSRDSKSIALFVEPWLIERGLIGITHGGRALTDAGVARAREL